MSRKILNVNGYYIGLKNIGWHNFLNTMSYLAIWLGIAAVVSIIVFIATLSIWV